MAENNSSAPLKTADGAAHQLLIALRTIAAYPVTNLLMNMDAANMQRIAVRALEAQAAPAAVAYGDGFMEAINEMDGLYETEPLATPALSATEDSSACDLAHDTLRCAVGNCTFNGEVAQHAAGCQQSTQPTRAEVQAESVALQMRSELQPRSESEKAAYLAGVADGRIYAERDAAKANAHALQNRAKELHEKAFMPWGQAEELALHEAGIDDAAIDELIGNCGSTGLSSILCTEDELRTFTRSVLVHQPAATAPQAQPADALDAAPASPINNEALRVIKALREWVMAVPADVAAALPAMPGIDADWMDAVEAALATHSAPADGLMVNMTPPATSRDRWMYNQGRLAEVERICAAIKTEDDYCVDQGDYMLDSDDCIKVARGTWMRPTFDRAAMAAAQEGGNAATGKDGAA